MYELKKVEFIDIYGENEIKIVASLNGEIVCEYIFEFSRILNLEGKNMIKTTLLSWATLEFCTAKILNINVVLSKFEKEYVEKNYQYCSKNYTYIYDFKGANLIFQKKQNKLKYSKKRQEESYFLGYTGGKDSTLCKILLENKKVEYYKVSYDNDEKEKMGHIYCKVYNKEIYEKTIISKKENSNIVSFHQADDIHVTFATPYTLNKEIYPRYLAIGIPWDAIHEFKNGIPDLVPTETYKSLKLFEKLIKNYGYEFFRVISPIASLHTYAVYKLLVKILGFDKLKELESCWNYNIQKQKPCGFCPKCQRLKKIFLDCWDYNYIEEVPTINIKSSGFLFGSAYATKILDNYSKKTVSESLLIDKYSEDLSDEFINIIKNKYGLKKINTHYIKYEKDEEVWEVIQEQIKNKINSDYSLMSDIKINNMEVPFLPFEKDYNWKRKNKILNCYDKIKINKKIINISSGNKIIVFENNNLMEKYFE